MGASPEKSQAVARLRGELTSVSPFNLTAEATVRRP